MERPLTHKQIQELLGAYALDAVDRDEADAIERHLAECPRCFDEVAGHREAAAMLAHVGAPAPAGVWDEIAARLDERGSAGEVEAAAGPAGEVEAEAGDVGSSGGLAEPGTHPGRSGPGVRRGGGTGDPGPGRAGPGAGPGRGRRSGRRPVPAPSRWLAGALAAAAVLVAVLGVQLVRIDNRLDRLTAVRDDDLDTLALAAFADPAARQVRLASDDGSKVADAALLPDGQAYLIARSLPTLSAAETYQLWAVVGDQKISVAVLGHAPSVAAFRYSAQPSVLAITAEKAGGVVASEKPAVAVGFVEPRSA